MPDSPTINDLVESADLIHVAILELSAARSDLSHTNDELFESFADGGYDAEIDFELGMDRGEHDDKFRVRLQVLVESDPGIVRVNVAAEYSINELRIDEISEEIMLEFSNKVAVMTLIPYIRQSVADISQRVFTYPLTLPLYKAGELSFS